MRSKLRSHCKRTMLVLVATLAAIAPAAMLAQTSGTGLDGYTRVYWQGTDSSVVIYKLDAALNVVQTVTIPAISGWIPIGLTVGGDDYTRLMWRNTDGQLSVWLMDPSLQFVSGYTYGPYAGWLPESTSVDPGGYQHIIWRHTLGYMAVWVLTLNQSNIIVSAQYPNPAGYTPGQEAALVGHSSIARSATSTPGKRGEQGRPLPKEAIPSFEPSNEPPRNQLELYHSNR